MWQGQADRTLTPAAYHAGAPKDGSEIRIVTVDAYAEMPPNRSLPGDEVFVFGMIAANRSFIALRSGFRLMPLAPMSGHARSLAGQFQVGDVREGDGACPEIAFAYLGQDSVELFEPCAVTFDADGSTKVPGSRRRRSCGCAPWAALRSGSVRAARSSPTSTGTGTSISSSTA